MHESYLNSNLVLAYIMNIHPDNMPEEALDIFRLIRIVEELPKDKLLGVLRRLLIDELAQSTDVPLGKIVEACSRVAAPTPLFAEETPAGMRLCTFLGCGRKHQAKGLCGAHRKQASRGIPLRPLQAFKKRRKLAAA